MTPTPGKPQLSAEAQHVINSLEAHFNAVDNAMKTGAAPWLRDHLEQLRGEVGAALSKFGAALAPKAAATSEAEPEVEVTASKSTSDV